jgi:hypothetical protein
LVFHAGTAVPWILAGSPVTIDPGTNYLRGLASTSHNDGTLCASTYDNVRSLTNISANRGVAVIPAANAKSSPARQWRHAKIPPSVI